jgi:hypothetical protein
MLRFSRLIPEDTVIVVGVAERDSDHAQFEPLANAKQKRHMALGKGDLDPVLHQRLVHLIAAFEGQPVNPEAEGVVEGLRGLGKLRGRWPLQKIANGNFRWLVSGGLAGRRQETGADRQYRSPIRR